MATASGTVRRARTGAAPYPPRAPPPPDPSGGDDTRAPEPIRRNEDRFHRTDPRRIGPGDDRSGISGVVTITRCERCWTCSSPQLRRLRHRGRCLCERCAGRSTGDSTSRPGCPWACARRSPPAWSSSSGAPRSRAPSATPSTRSSTAVSGGSRHRWGGAGRALATCGPRRRRAGPGAGPSGAPPRAWLRPGGGPGRACGRGLRLPVVDALERRQRTAAQHALGRTARPRTWAARSGSEPDAAAPCRRPMGGAGGRRVDHRRDPRRVRRGAARGGALAVSGLTVARER